MAAISWRFVHVAVVPITYAVVQYGPKSGFLGALARTGYFGCFYILASIALTLHLIWARFLWPIWFSPLADLPQPKVWLNVYIKKGIGSLLV